jgi:hypothetical protein
MMSWPSVPPKSEKGMDTSFHSEADGEVFHSRHASAAGGENHDAIPTRISTGPEVQRFFPREIRRGDRRRPRRKHRASPGIGQSIRDGPRNLQSAFAAVSPALHEFHLGSGLATSDGVRVDRPTRAKSCPATVDVGGSVPLKTRLPGRPQQRRDEN